MYRRREHISARNKKKNMFPALPAAGHPRVGGIALEAYQCQSQSQRPVCLWAGGLVVACAPTRCGRQLVCGRVGQRTWASLCPWRRRPLSCGAWRSRRATAAHWLCTCRRTPRCCCRVRETRQQCANCDAAPDLAARRLQPADMRTPDAREGERGGRRVKTVEDDSSLAILQAHQQQQHHHQEQPAAEPPRPQSDPHRQPARRRGADFAQANRRASCVAAVCGGRPVQPLLVSAQRRRLCQVRAALDPLSAASLPPISPTFPRQSLKDVCPLLLSTLYRLEVLHLSIPFPYRIHCEHPRSSISHSHSLPTITHRRITCTGQPDTSPETTFGLLVDPPTLPGQLIQTITTTVPPLPSTLQKEKT